MNSPVVGFLAEFEGDGASGTVDINIATTPLFVQSLTSTGHIGLTNGLAAILPAAVEDVQVDGVNPTSFTYNTLTHVLTITLAAGQNSIGIHAVTGTLEY